MRLSINRKCCDDIINDENRGVIRQACLIVIIFSFFLGAQFSQLLICSPCCRFLDSK
jgi:hypothetical protein